MAISQKKHLYSTRSRQVSAQTLDSIQVHLRRSIEAVWLTAAFLVPLIVLSEHDFASFTELPKTVLMRSLASLGLALWLTSSGVAVARRAATEKSIAERGTFSVRRWVLAHPIEAAAALVLFFTAISAALSIQPLVSALGADWGRDGYDLHTTASYIALFFLAATGIRRRDQLIRLWAVIAVSGLIAALIGIAQHFALAPFGISGTYQHQRVTGTVGNPLFLGALMTLTLPMGAALAMAAATRAVRLPGSTLFWWGALGVVVFIHAYAALFTASRGPWLGMAAALIAMVALTARVAGVRNAACAAISIAAGAGLAFVLVLGPASSAIESFAVAEQQELFNERETVSGSAPAEASAVISQRSKQGTIDARLEMWGVVGDVAAERPSLPESNNAPWVVRQLFGYGPDTFRFVFPTRAPGDLLNFLISSSHNAPLNWLIEIGLAGLLAYGALLTAAVVVVWKLTRRAQGGGVSLIAVLAVGAGAVVTGRVAEQLSGVARISDTTVLWLVLALLAAAYAITRRARSTSKPPAAEPNSGGFTLPRISPAVAFPVIAIGIALAGYFIWTHNLSLLRADMEFRRGETTLASDVDLALDHMERATQLNPGVEEYQHARAEVLLALADQSADLATKTTLLQEAYEAEHSAYSFNPTSRAANFELAFASWQLARLGDAGKAVETVQTYERLSELAPEHPLVIERLELLRRAVDGASAP